MKKVLLQYHVYEREYMIFDIIKTELEKNDCIVKISSMYDMYACFSFMPDVIITHTIRDEMHVSFIGLIKILTKATIIPLEVEGFFDLNNRETVKSIIGVNLQPKELIDYYLLWGNKNKEIEGKLLMEANKITSMDQICVCGYVFYDKERVVEYAQKLPINNSFSIFKRSYKKIITIVTGFISAETSVEDFLTMSSSNNKPGSEGRKKDIDAYIREIENSIEYRKKYIENILKLANDFKDYGFVVKLHPVEMGYIKNGKCHIYDLLRNIENIMIVDEAVPISLFLKDSKLLIHYDSTTSLESYIWNLPAILLYYNNHRELSYYTKAIEVRNYDELRRNIEHIPDFKENERIAKLLADSFAWRQSNEYCPTKKITCLVNKELSSNTITCVELRKCVRDLFFYRDRAKAYICCIKLILNKKNKEMKCIKRRATGEFNMNLFTFFHDVLYVLINKKKHPI